MDKSRQAVSVWLFALNLFNHSELRRVMDRSDPRLQRPPSVEALLRRRVIIGFILAVLLTGLIGFLSWRSTRLAAQEADLVAHTHAVMGTLDVTVEHAIELETSARGFALTGQDLLLTHYEAARGTINQDFGSRSCPVSAKP